jgi:hypothetical protein
MALVGKLQQSLSKPKNLEDDLQKESFGSWVGSESAEELIDSISSTRNSSRSIEDF